MLHMFATALSEELLCEEVAAMSLLWPQSWHTQMPLTSTTFPGQRRCSTIPCATARSSCPSLTPQGRPQTRFARRFCAPGSSNFGHLEWDHCIPDNEQVHLRPKRAGRLVFPRWNVRLAGICLFARFSQAFVGSLCYRLCNLRILAVECKAQLFLRLRGNFVSEELHIGLGKNIKVRIVANFEPRPCKFSSFGICVYSWTRRGPSPYENQI